MLLTHPLWPEIYGRELLLTPPKPRTVWSAPSSQRRAWPHEWHSEKPEKRLILELRKSQFETQSQAEAPEVPVQGIFADGMDRAGLSGAGSGEGLHEDVQFISLVAVVAMEGLTPCVRTSCDLAGVEQEGLMSKSTRRKGGRTGSRKVLAPRIAHRQDAPDFPGRLFERVVMILEEARSRVVRAVNGEMVVAYWLIGREIVEALQGGEARADYGAGRCRALGTP